MDAADKTVTVSGTVSATSVTAPATRTLTLEDDDAAGVTVSATALTVTEQDATGDSYTVVLDTEPTHEVTVTVGGHAGHGCEPERVHPDLHNLELGPGPDGDGDGAQR